MAYSQKVVDRFESVLNNPQKHSVGIEEAKLIKDKDIATALELPAIKLHCSVLAEDSIRQAIKDWEQKTIHRKHNYYKE